MHLALNAIQFAHHNACALATNTHVIHSIRSLEMHTLQTDNNFADSSTVRVNISRFHLVIDGGSLQQHVLFGLPSLDINLTLKCVRGLILDPRYFNYPVETYKFLPLFG